jgi:hypothetical protein
MVAPMAAKLVALKAAPMAGVKVGQLVEKLVDWRELRMVV